MKAAIIYDSRTNTTEKAAGFIAEGLKKTGDIEVKCFNIDNVDFDYVAGVDMAIFGSPTYMASVTGKMKNWLELNVRKLGLAGKLVIHLGPVGMSQNIEDFKELFVTYGERMGKQLLRKG